MRRKPARPHAISFSRVLAAPSLPETDEIFQTPRDLSIHASIADEVKLVVDLEPGDDLLASAAVVCRTKLHLETIEQTALVGLRFARRRRAALEHLLIK